MRFVHGTFFQRMFFLKIFVATGLFLLCLMLLCKSYGTQKARFLFYESREQILEDVERKKGNEEIRRTEINMWRARRLGDKLGEQSQ